MGELNCAEGRLDCVVNIETCWVVSTFTAVSPGELRRGGDDEPEMVGCDEIVVSLEAQAAFHRERQASD